MSRAAATQRAAHLGGVALLAAFTLWLAACAPLRAPDAPQAGPPQPLYSGRLSLQLDSAIPLGAEFDLQGDARAGRLLLSGPLGQTLAVLQWAPGQATLLQGSQQHVSASAGDLIERLTGAALPWDAFFSWLQGEAVVAAGWQVDLSRHADGQIVARRLQPGPRVNLRLQLAR